MSIGPFERPVNVAFFAASCDLCWKMIGEPDPGQSIGVWAPARISATLMQGAAYTARYQIDNGLKEQQVRDLAASSGWRVFINARGQERVICDQCVAEILGPILAGDARK